MTDSTRVTTVDLETALLGWIPQQRWFAAKGSKLVSLTIAARVHLGSRAGVDAEHLLVDIGLDAPVSDGGRVQRYQVPLGFRETPADGSADELAAWALPLPEGGVAEVYDGLRDPVIISMYGDLLAAADTVGPVAFRTVPGETVDSSMTGRVLGAEQSNTSVVLGETLLLKLFRQISPGINPDIELHRALAETGCENVAPLRAWLEAEIDGEVSMLGMAQDFVVDSAEGWTTALASVRDLLAGDLAPEDAAADFASEAFELGVAVARVHADLARQLGTDKRNSTASVDEILGRVEAAVDAVPELADHLPAARTLIARAEAAGTTTVQRIHGDLHLGQVLRTPTHWVLIDFEGEPAKTLEERRQSDSPLRDVAGMLRSFDYAAHHLLLGDETATPQTYDRATAWAQRNSDAFCDGYASVTGSDPRSEAALLGAYELDKAVYEAVYEARNRPTWLDIPMRAIKRLA
ncbi:MAG: hypothetical protein WBQ44_18015 [Rhodococcus sp. (in: high G+C Gram-positive bacteria)]